MRENSNTEYTRPDFRSMALVTIDTQRDFLAGQPFAIPGTSEILPRMHDLVQAFRSARLPIVHIVRLYMRDGSNVDLCRRRAVEMGRAVVCPGTLGAELAAPLLPDDDARLDANLLLSGVPQKLGPQEWAIYKPRWGAFYKTPLQEHLISLGITSLAFSGCNFPNCPRTSIYQASERDFRIVLIDDAMSGLYDRGREEMINIGVVLLSAAQLTKEVRSLS
jgi:nicotinamidase-related amidase